MALSINTNIASLQAQMNLNKASEAMKQNQERLSTGMRINSAADDAAGLAITDRMTSQIRGLDQAAANANDGISLAKTAEGAMDETTNILQRMRELAVQSANDSNTETDRQSIQDEVNQLIEEVDRIAENTTYNTKNVLNGLEDQSFQVGADEGQTIDFGIGSAKADDLGYFGGTNDGDFQMAKAENNVKSDLSNVTAGNNLQSLSEGDLAIDNTDIRATQTGDDTVSSTNNAASAIAIAAAINDSSDTTNVTAKAEQTEASFDLGTPADVTASGFSINGVTIGQSSGGTLGDVVSAINDKSDQTGVNASNPGSSTVALTAVDGRNIEVTVDSANASISADLDQGSTTVRGNVSLYSNESFEIGGENPNAADFSPGGVELTETNLQDVASTESDTFADIQQGDLQINGESVAVSQINETGVGSTSNVDGGASAAAIANGINNTDGIDNVEAEAYTTMNLGKVTNTSDAGTFEVNGNSVTPGAVQDGDSDGALVAAINNQTSDVVASVNDNNELELTSEDGINIDFDVTTASGSDFLGKVNTTTTDTDVAAKGTVSFTEGNKPDSIGGSAKALAGITDEDRTISTLDMTTQEGANEAIESIDKAIEQIDNEKAALGAYQNRFESTISNLNNVQQNITDARSRIQDADIAKESSEQTMNQVRRQAASSVLAQANQGPQLAMQLLGG